MKKLTLLLLLLLPANNMMAQLQVTHLRIENLDTPIGLDVPQPRFSWQLLSDQRNTYQTAYELKIGTSIQGMQSIDKITDSQSVHIPYKGAALQPGQRYYWQVRVWDNHHRTSAWSAPAYWQTGLLNPSHWKAHWITPGFTEDAQQASPLFRKSFVAHKKIRSATAYITAHGLYEAQLNGQRIGDAYFTPGWTSYNKRLQYQAYDVTALIRQGANAIGVTLGSGWYRGHIGWHTGVWGKDIALLFQLDIVYDNGATENIVSDNTWKSATGSILYAEIYHGETIDARLDKTGWTLPGYNDQEWTSVQEANFSKDILLATYNEPVKKHELIKPVRVFKTPAGEQVLDFGQNLAGWIVMTVKGEPGDKITLSHAEVLDKAGNFYTHNLREAKAQNTYILKGEIVETFEPHFTWQGFRYVKVEGYPGEITADNFTAVALYSAMEKTGTFTTSHPLINQLQSNIEWGLRGNFLDVPTDCPQRDERLGWTGDAQVFFRTAAFLRGVNNFFVKWMQDVAADQYPDGGVPKVIPNMLNYGPGNSGWSDAATIIPWNMYVAYGNKKILGQQYASMKAYVDYMTSESTNHLWNKGHQYGDWLFYSVNDDRDGKSAITDRYLIAQCFYAHSVTLLIKAANVLGKSADATQYASLLEKVRNAFVHEYTTANGATVSNTQTSYVLALQFDMLPNALQQQAADRLVANIKRYGNHLTTGFLGTPYLCHVLSRFGYTDMAYTLLLQTTYPSWLYPVKMGATTIWERWDGIKPDGSFQEASMNSFNHYAYGAIGDWMYRVVAGIDTEEDAPGYKRITIRPHIGGGLTDVSAALQTVYGPVSSHWKITGRQVTLEVEVPPNTRARIYIPAGSIQQVTEGGKPLPVMAARQEATNVVVEIGSGKYSFTTNLPS